MNWKLHFAWPLCVALSLVEARSATVRIVEVEQYEFTFETTSGGFWGYHHHTDERWYASENAGNGTHSPTATLWLWDYTIKPLDLSGVTLDLKRYWHPLDSLEAAYGPWDDWEHWDGSVTFGAENQIVEWDLLFYNDAGEEMEHWSEPVNFDPLYYHYWRWSAEDWSSFSGRAIYGKIEDAAPDYISFDTSSGRWLMTSQTYCLIEVDGDYGDQVPCPDPVPPATDSLAPVPLPSSLLLLASGLAGVGVLRRRRQLAG